MFEYKVARFPPKVAQWLFTTVLQKTSWFLISQKNHQTFGLILLPNYFHKSPYLVTLVRTFYEVPDENCRWAEIRLPICFSSIYLERFCAPSRAVSVRPFVSERSDNEQLLAIGYATRGWFLYPTAKSQGREPVRPDLTNFCHFG